MIGGGDPQAAGKQEQQRLQAEAGRQEQQRLHAEAGRQLVRQPVTRSVGRQAGYSSMLAPAAHVLSLSPTTATYLTAPTPHPPPHPHTHEP